jgi:hypothetical protein
MPDDKPKSGSPPAPSFYAKAGEMAAAQGAGGDKPGAGTPAGQSGEKVKNVKTLLEVFEKMDKLEQDPENKTLIQQMSDMAKQYMQKLEGGGKPGPASAPATGEAGSGGMGAGPGAGSGSGAPEMPAGAAA